MPRGSVRLSTLLLLPAARPDPATTPLRSCLDQEAAAAQDSSRERTIAVLTLAFNPVTRLEPAPRLGIGSAGCLSPTRVAQ